MVSSGFFNQVLKTSVVYSIVTSPSDMLKKVGMIDQIVTKTCTGYLIRIVNDMKRIHCYIPVIS